MEGITESVLSRAADLPLLDAAYVLWEARWLLNLQEREARSQFPDASPSPIGKETRPAISTVISAREKAVDGPTFTRLKQTHAHASDDELNEAIRRAAQFDTACTKYFGYRSPNYFDDCKSAVNKARAEYPGFLDETYESAKHTLMRLMR